MKAKSVSAQNLENLVKQTIDRDRLENNEKTIKFRQMIYEEWYFNELSESKDTKSEQNHRKPPEMNKQCISLTTAHRRSRRHKYKRRASRFSLEVQCAKTSEKIVEKGSEILKVKSLLPRNNVQSLVLDSNDGQNDFNFDKDMLLSTDPIKITDRLSGHHDSKLIEIWTNSKKRIETTDELGYTKNRILGDARTYDRNNRLRKQQQRAEKKLLSFEAWKKRKTITYRQILRKLRNDKQQNLLANLADTKWKNIARQAQTRKIRQQKYLRNQKLAEKYPDTIKRANVPMKSNCDRRKEKRIAEQPRIFYTSGKQRDRNFDKERITMLMTRNSNSTNYDRKPEIAQIHDSMENLTFYSWLDQLNWILHKKYLRERRHLVRSFYCQPLYYGDASLYAR